MIRPGGVLVAVVVALLAVCGCDPAGRPSLPPAFGARVSDGQLQIWTGSRCDGITRLDLDFKPSRAELVLNSHTERGVQVEHFALGGPYPTGLEVSQPLPEGFDWRNERSMRILTFGGSSSWGPSTDLTDVIKGSAQHPPDTYWFQDVGWLNPADVAAKDGKTFLATCTPDPTKER